MSDRDFLLGAVVGFLAAWVLLQWRKRSVLGAGCGCGPARVLPFPAPGAGCPTGSRSLGNYAQGNGPESPVTFHG